jgi:multiple antibiotic resistance protein
LAHLITFLKSLALVPLTLLPIINPLGTAPIFAATAGKERAVVRKFARQVAVNSAAVLVVSMLVGIYVLDFFGISLPIVRLGGGLMVASMGWRTLNSGGDDAVQQAVAHQAAVPTDREIAQHSFYPLTFPLTTGPGSIAAAIALGVHLPREPIQYLLGAVVAVLGAAVTALVIFLCYRHSNRLLARLGEIGTIVIMRLFAFILLCIGIEIMWAGWAALNHLP